MASLSRRPKRGDDALPGQLKLLPYDLVVFAMGAAGIGWMAANESYIGAVVFALIGMAGLWDFQRGYRRNLTAARKWREQRWNALKALAVEYRAEVHKNMPASIAELDLQLREAEQRAEAQIEERYGPLT